MSRTEYHSEPEEFISALKEKIEERDEKIRELEQTILLQKGLMDVQEQRIKDSQKEKKC